MRKKYCFIWHSASNLSRNYHDGGGYVAFADSIEEARAVLIEAKLGEYYEKLSENHNESSVHTTDPTYQIDLEKAEGSFIFINAGCC